MDVIVKLVTKTQAFPVDTVDTDFTYTLTSTDAGGVNVSETDAGTSTTFPGVAAGEDQCGAHPQQPGNLDVLPIDERARAGKVCGADGDEQRRDGEQVEPHREQPRARPVRRMPAVIAAVIAASAAIAGRHARLVYSD